MSHASYCMSTAVGGVDAGWFRKSLGRAIGRGSASANAKTHRKLGCSLVACGLRLAACRSRVCVIKINRYFLVWTTVLCATLADPRFAAEDVRYFSPSSDIFQVSLASVMHKWIPDPKALVAVSCRELAFHTLIPDRFFLILFSAYAKKKISNPSLHADILESWEWHHGACQHVIRRAAGAVGHDNHSCHSPPISASSEL